MDVWHNAASRKQKQVERERIYEQQASEAIIRQRARHNHLSREIGKESARITTILEDARWPGAELKAFTARRKRWLPARAEGKYHCLNFDSGASGGQRSLWMRSDGKLYIQDIEGNTLRDVHSAFRYSRRPHIEKKNLELMQACLAQLRSFISIKPASN